MSSEELAILQEQIEASAKDIFLLELREKFLTRQLLGTPNTKAVDDSLKQLKAQLHFSREWDKFINQVKTGQVTV